MGTPTQLKRGCGLDTVRFTEVDAELLYAIPKPGGDIAKIINCVLYLNRAPAPSRFAIESCITKAVQAGCLKLSDSRILVVEEWYDRIHACDATAANEVQSMLSFQAELLCRDWSVKSRDVFTLSEADYEAAIQKSFLA